MDATVDAVCNLLVRSRLLSAAEVQSLRKRWLLEAGAATADVGLFAKWLVANKHVTEFQIGLILLGRADHFFLNQYKLLDRIGKGRMAGVYQAVHETGQVVAIKVLPPSRAREPEALARFQREARLALRLRHPNVVRTFQTGVAGGVYYLVMEYLDGETLEDFLQRRGKLPPVEAVGLVRQALRGLQHIHDQGMVHRDLKPANLMLVAVPSSAGHQITVKILDIGVGRALFDEGDPAGANMELTAEGEILGDPAYLAPEQARNAHAADIRADVYSLGCVLYHALAGQPPFTGPNRTLTILRHLQEAPRPLKDFEPAVPDDLQQIVSRMLAKDPAVRYPTPDQATRDLEGFLSRQKAAPRPKTAVAASPAVDAYEAWLQAEAPRPTTPPTAVMPAPIPTPPLNEQRPGRAPLRRHRARALVGVGLAVLCGAMWLGYTLVAKPGRPDRSRPVAATRLTAARQQTFDEWVKDVAGQEPEKQVAAVAARLQERNPGFDGLVKHGVHEGAVTELEFVTDNVTDLRPVRALPKLKRLGCAGSDPGKGKLADLSALRGLDLAVLDCSSTQVADLSPLKGMPLVFLGIAGTQVRDLAPLEGAPLMALNCAGTAVTDLSPLRGMPLTLVDAADTPVEDLSPLQGMPLEALWCTLYPPRDGDLLRPVRTLKEINGKPAADFWKAVEAGRANLTAWARQVAALPVDQQVQAVADKLKELNPRFDGQVKPKVERGAVVELRFFSDDVTDIAPVRALPGLLRLFCNGSGPGKGRLANLQPLKGMRLTELDCGSSQVADLAPLQGLPLTYLNLSGNDKVRDLAPLRNMRLTRLNLAGTRVSDLAPLKGMGLTSLACHGTLVADLGPLSGMPLTGLSCDFEPVRDLDVLRSLKSLDKINNKLWQEVDGKERAREAWVKKVSALPPDEQLEAVAAELRERNPKFDGKVTPRLDRGVVAELRLQTDNVMDIAPVRALPALRKLAGTGSGPGKGKLADLWPLKGLPLRELVLTNNPVRDLTPLKGLPLEALDLSGTPVNDLGQLQKVRLASLDLSNTKVTDLSPLKEMPLKHFKGNVDAGRDQPALQPIKTLLTVNGKPAAGLWEVGAATPLAEKKPAPVARLVGKLVKVHPEEMTFTLQLTQSVVVQNPWHTYWLNRHRLNLLLDTPKHKDPIDRMRFVQDNLFWIAYHQSNLYRRHDQHQDVELQAAEDAHFRVLQQPPVYDDKGNVRKPTAKELAEMKGPDPRLPGFVAEFSALKPGQVVDVYLARSDALKVTGKENAKDPPPDIPLQATLVVAPGGL